MSWNQRPGISFWVFFVVQRRIQNWSQSARSTFCCRKWDHSDWSVRAERMCDLLKVTWPKLRLLTHAWLGMLPYLALMRKHKSCSIYFVPFFFSKNHAWLIRLSAQSGWGVPSNTILLILIVSLDFDELLLPKHGDLWLWAGRAVFM